MCVGVGGLCVFLLFVCIFVCLSAVLYHAEATLKIAWTALLLLAGSFADILWKKLMGDFTEYRHRFMFLP